MLGGNHVQENLAQPGLLSWGGGGGLQQEKADHFVFLHVENSEQSM